jgi:CheY-like chemotaxis protein/DNA-directed RNA polymerase specialized sigma24 family protein
MSISQDIAGYIPYLRRFGRALVGSREGGDACVMAALEALVADPRRIAGASELRVALYRLLLDVWAQDPGNAPVEPQEATRGARQRLEGISLRPRIAFLLHALEGFDEAQVGDILGVTEEEAVALMRAANTEIADQIATNVLIIEDEPLIAHDLRSIVEELGHNVCGMARTHREAVAAIGAAKPGLILADIQLADGSSGLDAVNEILGALSTPVIFITAYPERFLTGAPPEPAFLVTKPFSVDSLKVVISQALFFDRRSRPKDV